MTARGRRPGDEDTRQVILDSARRLFAEQGYERASMRAIARDAAVDPALIVHYFGSKEDLLGEALQMPLNPGQVTAGIAQLPPDQRGAAFVRVFLAAWERPEIRDHMLSMLRTAASHEVARERFATTLHDGVEPVIESLVADQPQRRAALVISQMAGLAMTRYLVKIPEVVALSVDEIVADVGATVQRYLTGELD
jgi:AcrR family transcriptional regulator